VEVGKGEEDEHHGSPDIACGYYTLLLAVHGLGEEAECFLDLGFFLGCDVVLFRELGLPGLCACVRFRGGWSAFWWLVVEWLATILVNCESGCLPC
jgi:hypothetical protein